MGSKSGTRKPRLEIGQQECAVVQVSLEGLHQVGLDAQCGCYIPISLPFDAAAKRQGLRRRRVEASLDIGPQKCNVAAGMAYADAPPSVTVP